MAEKFFRSYAFVVVMLSFLQTMTTMAMQFGSLNFAVVCMGENHCDMKSHSLNGSTIINSTTGIRWNKRVMANVLAAFPYGVIAGTIVISVIVDSVSVRAIFRIGSLTCLLSSLIPVASRSWHAVFAIRFLLGALATGPSLAAASKVPAYWCDNESRGTALGIILSGLAAGQLVMKPLAGYLCCTIGWEWIFYMASMFAMANLLLHIAFFKEHPATSHRSGLEGVKNPPKPIKHRRPPLKMFLSFPVLAIIINGYAEKTLQFFVQVFMPTYLTEALRVDTLQVGLLSALPELTQLISRPLAGLIGDKLKCAKSSTINVKVYNSIGCIGSIAMLFALTYIKPGQQGLAVASICVQFIAGSFFVAGFYKSIVTIAPGLTGMLMAMSTVAAFTSAVILPYVVSGFTAPDGALYKWNHVIYFVMAVTLLAALCFVAFGTMTVQSWAEHERSCGDKAVDGSELVDLVK